MVGLFQRTRDFKTLLEMHRVPLEKVPELAAPIEEVQRLWESISLGKFDHLYQPGERVRILGLTYVCI